MILSCSFLVTSKTNQEMIMAQGVDLLPVTATLLMERIPKAFVWLLEQWVLDVWSQAVSTVVSSFLGLLVHVCRLGFLCVFWLLVYVVVAEFKGASWLFNPYGGGPNTYCMMLAWGSEHVIPLLCVFSSEVTVWWCLFLSDLFTRSLFW